MIFHIAYRILKLTWSITRPITTGVRVMAQRGDELLLVKHRYQDTWLFPGGGLHRQETLEQAARREAFEEAGAELGELSLVGIYSNFVEGKSDHIVLFQAEILSCTGKSDWEIAEVRFFSIHDMPDDLAPGCRRRLVPGQGSRPHHGLW